MKKLKRGVKEIRLLSVDGSAYGRSPWPPLMDLHLHKQRLHHTPSPPNKDCTSHTHTHTHTEPPILQKIWATSSAPIPAEGLYHSGTTTPPPSSPANPTHPLSHNKNCSWIFLNSWTTQERNRLCTVQIAELSSMQLTHTHTCLRSTVKTMPLLIKYTNEDLNLCWL